MVAPETIRKGSKVYFADTQYEPVTVFDNVNGEISVQLKQLVKTSPEELYPVPLNPDIICRSGFFKTDEYVFEHPVEKVEVELDHRGVCIMRIRSDETSVEVTSLHELQHTFWKYTNKDLDFR
jgi:hypothetical protein